MKIIFNKYGGIKTIEDRQLLVQSSDNANYVDIYYQDDAGNFADETVNLATIAFKRSDSFEIMERTCDAVREELTNKILYFRYIFQEDELAVNGELQITVRLKQVVFDPEDDSKVLLIKQRAMGKITAHIYEAIGGNYENFDVVDGRILQLELWQANFESDYYNADQIDAKLVLERQATNDSLDDHNTSNEAHENIRQTIENLDNTLQEQIDTINGTLSEHDFRINELEDFASNLEIDITEEIENAVADKADLVDGKVPREQMDDYFDDIIEGFYINHQFYSEGEENEDYLITPELGKLYVDVDTNVLYRWIGSQYEKVTSTFELTKAKIEEKLTGDITSHNHATEINEHNTNENAHSDIRQLISDLQDTVDDIETIIGSIDGEEDADNVINKLHEIVALLNGYAEGTTLVDLLSGKVDKVEGKGLSTNDLTNTLKSNYDTAYTHSQSTHAPSNAQKNVQSDWNQTDNTKDDYIKNKPTIPTLRPTIELEVASLTTLTELEKLTIKNQLSSLIVDDKIDGSKFDDIVLVTTSDLIRLHYSSIDYYVANPQITVIFETQTQKYILNIVAGDYTHSTLTSTTTTIPTISTSITTDATDDTKTASPKAVKTYVDNAINSAILGLLGGES